MESLSQISKQDEEQLNIVLREHESKTEDWDYQNQATKLYWWFDIFNAEFFDDQLPTCFLRVARLHVSCLGHYRRGRNDVGAKHEICLNILHLSRPIEEVLQTMLHEMCHEWEVLFGKPGHRNYHTKAFVAKCRSMGIPCSGGYRSMSLGFSEPFLSLLAHHGVKVTREKAVALPDSSQPTQPKGTSTLKLWMCACTRIRAAVELDAFCRKCNQSFTKRH